MIAQGQFAEAQALIAESAAAGLITQQVAARMLERITLLNTRLGQVPATLQRVADFPSQLRDFTLFQIKQLLERRDFTLATQSQLKLAEKLIEQQERLMEKVQ
jgi:DNA-binding transcriptional regulator WhiA